MLNVEINVSNVKWIWEIFQQKITFHQPSFIWESGLAFILALLVFEGFRVGFAWA
jgi:hypothetical protein